MGLSVIRSSDGGKICGILGILLSELRGLHFIKSDADLGRVSFASAIKVGDGISFADCIGGEFNEFLSDFGLGIHWERWVGRDTVDDLSPSVNTR